MITNITDDFDEESQNQLDGLRFLDFSQLQENYNGLDALDDLSGDTSLTDITNEMALASPLKKRSSFYKPNYVDDDIDFPKLVQLILGKKDAEFNWKNYIGHKTITVTRNYSFGEDAKFDRQAGIDTSIKEKKVVKTEVPLREENLLGEHVLRLKGRLNTEVNIVNIKKDNDTDLTNGLEFEFDYERRKVSYKLHYYYVDRKRVYERNNKNNIAFTISTSYYSDFEALLRLCELNYREDSSFKKEISSAFIDAIAKVNALENAIPNSPQRLNAKKFGELEWLYINIPTFVARELDFDQTVFNIFQLNGWDGSSWYYDTTQSITTILSRLNPEDVYSYFNRNPQSLLELLDNFDGDALIESFCQYLTVVALHKKGKGALDGARKFSLNEDTHIESNILFGDPSGKVELVNEKQTPILPYPYIGINIYNFFAGDEEINNPKNESNFFHPLDLIYLSRYDEELKEEVKIPTIALYAKYLGDKGEWADVLTATFAVIDLVSIVLSGGALAAGVRGVARVFAIIDISVSTINLALLSPEIKKALSKTEAGKWFVAHWPLISFCVGSGMISVYLAKGILKYGSRVKTQIKNNDALTKNIDELLDESKKVVDGVKTKKTAQFKQFVKKWEGKSITNLSLKEISENLKGFTQQANRIAKLIDEGKMIIKILDDTEFEKLLMKYGETLDEAKATEAFNIGDRNYFRSSKPVDEFMSEIVHEGTHTLDDINGFKGDVYQIEKRAFFHERAFQEATQINVDFKEIDDLLNFIYTNY
ncbi:hypothetical protein [Psychroserpens luteolus]|uniref:hypothetical protein n=1 Tax=Psychroserpens luteolus TaxID=2855840 RepID=UPI001E426497|nr:hypothetical protein [Psychroserpens luteolus]MCD2258291.1 hypothetical protein [Psychroserpens luteolus]